MSPPKLLSGFLGGLFIGILSALPYVQTCCCLWLVVGGVLAAYVMQANYPYPVGTGSGIAVGLLAGLVSALVFPVATLIVSALMGVPFNYATEQMLEGMHDMPPELRNWLEGPGAGVVTTVMNFGFFAVSALILAPIGGMIGVVLFRKPTSPPPSAPPPMSPLGSTWPRERDVVQPVSPPPPPPADEGGPPPVL